MRKSAAGPEAGFTLLELLVSIVLLAFLTTILFGGLRLASHQLVRRSNSLDQASRLALVQNFLRVEMGDARPLTQDDTPGAPVEFGGSTASVDFVGVAPESAVAGGLQAFSVGFVRGRDASTGELRISARFIRAAGSGGTHEAVLLDGLESAAFAYFGITERDDAPSWHSTWEGESYLPSLFRLSLTFAGGRTVPDLIIALRLSEDPGLRLPPAGAR